MHWTDNYNCYSYDGVVNILDNLLRCIMHNAVPLLTKFCYEKPRFAMIDVLYAVVVVTVDVDGDFVDAADYNTNECTQAILYRLLTR